MGYLNIGPSDSYTYSGAVGWVVSAYQPEISISLDSIDSIREIGYDLIVQLTYSQGGNNTVLYVGKNTQSVVDLNTDPSFLYVAGIDNLEINPITGIVSSLGNSVTINRSKIDSVTTTSTLSKGRTVYTILFEENGMPTAVNTTQKIAIEATNQDVVVKAQPATEFIFTNPLSLCYDITVVNHATGATNTFHTPLREADYILNNSNYVVPFGGFSVTFTGPGTYIYFFDNDGNLVDQIDGVGPSYDWGDLDYRLVWASDSDTDPAVSVVKIFDGKNVRTHEFPYFASFNMSPFNLNDCSKNLYVPFVVDDIDANESYLYISTPGGGLIDLDNDSWFDNEDFSVIHPTSDKIFRLTDDGDGMLTALDVYTEDGIKINSLNLTSYGLNDWDNRDYYGTAGDFYTVLYNWEDNTVPYLFVAYRAATNTFATFTSTTAVDGYNVNAQDFELYERNNGAANVLSIIIGEDFGRGITGMISYNNGGTIHWLPANGKSWRSYEINEGDRFQISDTDDDNDDSSRTGAFGTYPLFIITSDTINANLHTLLLLETGVDIGDTGIAIADAVSVNTSTLGDVTYAQIEITNAPANLVSWSIYSDTAMPTAGPFITGKKYEYRPDGGTIVVLDTDDANNNWSYAGNGEVTVPLATGSFKIAKNQFGGYWNPWGYATNGKLVLIDIVGLAQVVGFYFLSETSTSWTYMPNAWDDGTGRAWEKGLNNFAFMTWNGGLFAAGGYVYMNYDMTTGALISAGTSEMRFGGNFAIIAVGDRMSARTEMPVTGDYEFNCFTGAGIVKVTTPATHNLAFNDATWSWC